MFRDRRVPRTSPVLIPEKSPTIKFDDCTDISIKYIKLVGIESDLPYIMDLKQVTLYLYISKKKIAVTLHTSGQDSYNDIADIFNNTYNRDIETRPQSIWCNILSSTTIQEDNNIWTLDEMIDIVCEADVKLNFVAYKNKSSITLIPRVKSICIRNIQKSNCSVTSIIPLESDFAELSIVGIKKCYTNYAQSEWDITDCVTYAVLETPDNAYRIITKEKANKLAYVKYVLNPNIIMNFKGCSDDSVYHHYAITLKDAGHKQSVYDNMKEYVRKRSLDVRGMWYKGTDTNGKHICKIHICNELPLEYVALIFRHWRQGNKSYGIKYMENVTYWRIISSANHHLLREQPHDKQFGNKEIHYTYMSYVSNIIDKSKMYPKDLKSIINLLNTSLFYIHKNRRNQLNYSPTDQQSMTS